MRKLIKIFSIFFVIFILILYCGYLFVLPNVVDLNEYKPEIQKAVKDAVNLNVDFQNPKISVSPLFAAGIKADNFTVKLNDDSDFIKSDSFDCRISVPLLLFRNIKISKLEINNPVINIDIIDGKAFKAVRDYEELLETKEKIMEKADAPEPKTQAETGYFDLSKFKITIPSIKLTDYVLNVNDLKTSEYLRIKGEKLKVGYYHGERAVVKTNAELYLNDEKKINAKLDIDTVIRAVTKLDNEDDKAQRVNITFVNPVSVYKSYNLKADIDSKLKIRKKKDLFTTKGYVNIDKFTLMLSGLQLPESNLHLKTDGRKAQIDTDLFVTPEEEIKLSGKVNFSQKPSCDIKLKTTEINTDNVLTLVKATLDSLHIRHELEPLKGFGSLNADVSIKTNLKKLKSAGYININNLAIKDTKINAYLFRLNSYVSLEKNILNIKNTFAEIAQTVINIRGSIDSKSITDINLDIEKLPLERVFTLLLPNETKDAYTVNSGDINIDVSVKGEMKKAPASINMSVENVSLKDKKNEIDYTNKLLKAIFVRTSKGITGNLTDEGFKLEKNGVGAGCEDFKITLGEKDIDIAPGKIKINNSTEIDFGGYIKNYAKKPLISIFSDGFIRTVDIKQFLGRDFEQYFDNKGMLHLQAGLNGNSKKQKFDFCLDADKENYITPVKIDALNGKNTVLRAEVDFKGDRLKIKNTGLYIKQLVPDEKNPEKMSEKLTEIFGIDGTVTKLNTSNPNINMIKFKFPQEIKGNIFIFPESVFSVKGHAFLFGGMQNPQLRGGFEIYNVKIPELFLTLEKAASKFEGKEIYTEIKNADINGSDFNLLINTDINPADVFTIKNIKLSSNYTDVDNLLPVSEAVAKYIPQSENTVENTADNADKNIPVSIKAGSASITKIKSGNIILEDTISSFLLQNNRFILNDILTSVFQGKVRGSAGIDLITGEIRTALNGTGLDTEETLYYTAGLKDTLTGMLDFDTNLEFSGSTNEEIMKNLKGVFNFSMKNGKLGPFGKLENLIMAENIRESSFFQSAIGSIINSALTFDTARYNNLSGHILFDNGIAKLNPIKSEGNVMSTNITGEYDLIKNTVDIKFRGRLGSVVSDALDPLSLLNPVNLIKATPGMSIIAGKVFFLFTECVTPEEMKQIPKLGNNISETNTTKFQVILRGDANKPLSLVKSFKWLALQGDIDKAKEYVAKNEAEEALKPEEEKNEAGEDKPVKEQKSENTGSGTQKSLSEKFKAFFTRNN